MAISTAKSSIRVQVHQRIRQVDKDGKHYELNIYTDNYSYQDPFEITDS